MKRSELFAELAERADAPATTTERVLNEMGKLFLEWITDSDELFPLGYIGSITKQRRNGRLFLKYNPSRQALDKMKEVGDD